MSKIEDSQREIRDLERKKEELQRELRNLERKKEDSRRELRYIEREKEYSRSELRYIEREKEYSRSELRGIESENRLLSLEKDKNKHNQKNSSIKETAPIPNIFDEDTNTREYMMKNWMISDLTSELDISVEEMHNLHPDAKFVILREYFRRNNLIINMLKIILKK